MLCYIIKLSQGEIGTDIRIINMNFIYFVLGIGDSGV